MLKKVCENVIKTRKYDLEDMQLKIDSFWAAGKLTTAEYEELYLLMEQYPPLTQ